MASKPLAHTGKRRLGEHRPQYDPTPDEIATACLAIQATWSESERRRRIVGPFFEAQTPIVAVADVAAGL